MTEPEERVCQDCGMSLSADETWVCEGCCAFYEMTDPNFRMEDEDGKSHQAAEEA